MKKQPLLVFEITPRMKLCSEIVLSYLVILAALLLACAVATLLFYPLTRDR